MASIECSNDKCKKMLGYDQGNNIQVVASSILLDNEQFDIKIDIKCPRCKRHNYLTRKK